MKKVIMVLPAGRAIVIGNGVNGVLEADTEIAFIVHDAALAPEGIIEAEDVVASALVAGYPELIPLLTHDGEKGITVGYTPSGTRVEQTKEAVDAVAAVEALPAEERANSPVEEPEVGTEVLGDSEAPTEEDVDELQLSAEDEAAIAAGTKEIVDGVLVNVPEGPFEDPDAEDDAGDEDEESVLPSTDPEVLDNETRETLDGFATTLGVDTTQYSKKYDLAVALIAAEAAAKQKAA